MCGIAGILGISDGSAGRERLLAMRDAMTHRGPDGCGLWQDPAHRVGLAHRRLSIVEIGPISIPVAMQCGRSARFA